MHFEKRIPLFLQLGLNEASVPKLKAYLDLLWTANEDLNLVSRKMTTEELIDNHVIDCLLPLSKFPVGLETVADFGSGGGLPGVLYALQFPEISFQLFEKSSKKSDFLIRCRKLAPNLEIHGEIPPKFGGVDLIMARAFKPMDVILEVSRDYFHGGGRYFLMKGRREKIEEEILLARQKFKTLDVNIHALTSPVLEVERHLVQIP